MAHCVRRDSLKVEESPFCCSQSSTPASLEAYVNKWKAAFCIMATAIVAGGGYVSWSLYGVSRAHAFAEALMTDIVKQGTAAKLPPQTPVMAGVRPETRREILALAQRLGPIRKIERTACAALPTRSPEQCGGAAYLCHFAGQLDSGAFSARFSACRDAATGDWQLAGMHWTFPATAQAGPIAHDL
jgi:hypothetical protein